jgi:hypothetical protein
MLTAPENGVLKSLVLTLTNAAPLVRSLALEAITTACLFSPTGYRCATDHRGRVGADGGDSLWHRSVMDAYNFLQEAALEGSRFETLVKSLLTVADVDCRVRGHFQSWTQPAHRLSRTAQRRGDAERSGWCAKRRARAGTGPRRAEGAGHQRGGSRTLLHPAHATDVAD